MPTLGDLMNKFASASGDAAPTNQPAAVGVPLNKHASEGEKNMNSLQNIYLAIAGQDLDKTASVAAQTQTQTDPAPESTDDVDFAKMAADLAEKEAAEQTGGGDGGEEIDFVKIAAEYDSAGRIMARGFYDEFMKLAGNMSTTAPDNHNTESPSAAKTDALGNRGLPTLATNFAGNDAHDQTPQMTGSAPKQVYSGSLKPSKTISAGDGTGDDPEGKAISLGGGSPSGFATVRDLQA